MSKMLQIKDQTNAETRELITKFLRFLEVERKYSLHTINSYRTDIFYFFDFLFRVKKKLVDKAELENLSVHDFRKWLAERMPNHVNSSNARAISSLRSFLRFLHKNNLLQNRQIEKMKTPKIAKAIPKSVDQIDIKRIFDVIFLFRKVEWQAKRDVALLTLIYGCGLRISESLAVSKKSLENANHLIVNGKGKKQRMVPLLPVVRQKISEYLSACPFEIKFEQPAFLSAKGKTYARSDFSALIKKIRLQLNLPETVTPHAFRHSFATHLLEAGGDLRSIQQLLGHESLGSTQIYTKVDKTRLLSVYEKLQKR